MVSAFQDKTGRLKGFASFPCVDHLQQRDRRAAGFTQKSISEYGHDRLLAVDSLGIPDVAVVPDRNHSGNLILPRYTVEP